MLDIDLSFQTSSIDSFIAFMKKYQPSFVTVSHVGQLQHHSATSYSAFCEAVVNGRPSAFTLTVAVKSSSTVGNKSDLIYQLGHMGVPDHELAQLKKTSIRKMQALTHEQISETEEKTTQHVKNELGVYHFTSDKGTKIKVTFDLQALANGTIYSRVEIDSGIEVEGYTERIRAALPEGAVLLDDCSPSRMVHVARSH
jgi:hypothetical protein